MRFNFGVAFDFSLRLRGHVLDLRDGECIENSRFFIFKFRDRFGRPAVTSAPQSSMGSSVWWPTPLWARMDPKCGSPQSSECPIL